ncbi:MAG: ABC transporter substrate-binding protein [Betaproteobacteria bacterium]
MRRLLVLIGLVMVPAAAAAQGQLNVICSVQIEWCQILATVFAKSSGVKVNMVQKGSGESVAQLAAEAANPRTDLWFGGTGDPHLQAAERGLTQEYRSPRLADLQDWAQGQAKSSGYRTVGIYLGVLGIGYNEETLAKKKLAKPACWADLLKPEYRGELQIANPNSSGTAYVAIASLVQIMGEEKAFEFLKRMHRNVSQYTRSGTAPIKNVARGETVLSVSFIHDAVTEAVSGFPATRAIAPCEGTGYEIGSMSIVKGARNLENAKKFYDWALTPATQEMAAAEKSYQIPSNRAAKVHPLAPNPKAMKLINYDFAKYGSSAERKRLLDRWDKDVNSLPRS